MKRHTKVFIAAGLLAVLVLIASLLLSGGGDQEVKNVVIVYNQMLVRAHRELKTGLMENITGPRELSKIDNYLAYLVKTRRVFIGELLDIEFIEVKVAADTAVVVTRERWKYHYVDPATRQPVSDEFEPVLGNIYTLKKTLGHWVVDDLDSREVGGKTEG